MSDQPYPTSLATVVSRAAAIIANAKGHVRTPTEEFEVAEAEAQLIRPQSELGRLTAGMPGDLGVAAAKLKDVLTKEARRNAAADLKRIQACHDLSVELGAGCTVKTGTGTDVPGASPAPAVRSLARQLIRTLGAATKRAEELVAARQRVAELEATLAQRDADIEEAKALVKQALAQPVGRKHHRAAVSSGGEPSAAVLALYEDTMRYNTASGGGR